MFSPPICVSWKWIILYTVSRSSHQHFLELPPSFLKCKSSLLVAAWHPTIYRWAVIGAAIVLWAGVHFSSEFLTSQIMYWTCFPLHVLSLCPVGETPRKGAAYAKGICMHFKVKPVLLIDAIKVWATHRARDNPLPPLQPLLVVWPFLTCVFCRCKKTFEFACQALPLLACGPQES